MNEDLENYENYSGDDLQELSEKQNDNSWPSEFIENCYNGFMVLYFKHGYSFKEAHKKAMESVDFIITPIEDDGTYDEMMDNKIGDLI